MFRLLYQLDIYEFFLFFFGGGVALLLYKMCTDFIRGMYFGGK